MGRSKCKNFIGIINGKGECKFWYENGQLKEQVSYRNGKREGEFKLWRENGQLWVKEFYREGEYKTWCQNGQRGIHAFYRDGNLISLAFSLKKCAMLRVKKYLQFRHFSTIANIYMISDLVNMVC